MEVVTLHDKSFTPYISNEKLQETIRVLGQKISCEYEGKELLLLGVLNGAFRFVADLSSYIHIPLEISFVKMASYDGMETTGKVNQLIGLSESLETKHVIIVEDIVDTGNTLVKLMDEVEQLNPKSIKIATLLYKPKAYSKSIPIDYIGMEIPNDFIVGYGLDYNRLGRNLNSIYKIQS